MVISASPGKATCLLASGATLSECPGLCPLQLSLCAPALLALFVPPVLGPRLWWWDSCGNGILHE